MWCGWPLAIWQGRGVGGVLEAVCLPFCTPPFATTHPAAAAGLAIAGHPSAFNAYLNQCATLSCTRRFLRSAAAPLTGNPGTGLSCFSFLERCVVDLRFAHPYCGELIRRMLAEGFYVYFRGVDDYDLPGKSWYGLRHLSHDGILCGYDDRDGSYSIAAYDSCWVFRLLRVPQECFHRGMEACLARGEAGALLACRVRENTAVALDLPLMLRRLREHLANTADRFPPEQEGEVTGVAVYEFLALYLERLRDGGIPAGQADRRALRPVWEHARCMLRRLCAVEQALGWEPVFSAAYAPLAEQADRLRLMYAMFRQTRRAGLLAPIARGLRSLGRQEADILRAFIRKAEETEGIVP